MRVHAQQGDSIDSLCWRHLGSSAAVETVLESNRGLAALGPILPIGTPVDLPDQVAARENKIIQLWE